MFCSDYKECCVLLQFFCHWFPLLWVFLSANSIFFYEHCLNIIEVLHGNHSYQYVMIFFFAIFFYSNTWWFLFFDSHGVHTYYYDPRSHRYEMIFFVRIFGDWYHLLWISCDDYGNYFEWIDRWLYCLYVWFLVMVRSCCNFSVNGIVCCGSCLVLIVIPSYRDSTRHRRRVYNIC